MFDFRANLEVDIRFITHISLPHSSNRLSRCLIIVKLAIFHTWFQYDITEIIARWGATIFDMRKFSDAHVDKGTYRNPLSNIWKYNNCVAHCSDGLWNLTPLAEPLAPTPHCNKIICYYQLGLYNVDMSFWENKTHWPGSQRAPSIKKNKNRNWS